MERGKRKKRVVIVFILILLVLLLFETKRRILDSNKVIYYSNYIRKNHDCGILENTILKYESLSNYLIPILCKVKVKLNENQIDGLEEVLKNKDYHESGNIGTCGIYGCLISYNKVGSANKIVFLTCGISQLEGRGNIILLNEKGHSKLANLLSY
jgi:hypothetical protein